MFRLLPDHWPEYAIEAAGLGIFMIVAGTVWTGIAAPGSPITPALSPLAQRAVMGIAMGATAAALIYSPWGRRSGAHFNPAVTLTFLRLKKISRRDAAFYSAAQFLGGLIGVLIVYAAFGQTFAAQPVNFIATVPGEAGASVAFLAELALSFALMLVVLYTSNRVPLMRATGALCGILIALFVTFEAPLSGMSINPARTFASALPGGIWTGAWIYFTAPIIGMLAAVDAYRILTGERGVLCAKLNHNTHQRCIFHCAYREHDIAVPKLLDEHSSLPVRHPLEASGQSRR